MSNVIIDKTKIDLLANAIADKSGEPITMTLDEMVEAVDGIDTGGITPTGNIAITHSGTTDVAEYATATVPNATYLLGVYGGEFYTESNVRKYREHAELITDSGEGPYNAGWIDEDTYFSNNVVYNAVSPQTITPTENTQSIGGARYMMEGAVTINAIPSNYIGSNIPRRTSTDLSVTGANVSVPAGFYEDGAGASVASGTEGTPTATKGTVSNHAISVTPSVTNTAGYISGGTKTGTAVSVSASELVSGTVNITSSGNTDVTNYATASVASGSLSNYSWGREKTSTGYTLAHTVNKSAGYIESGTQRFEFPNFWTLENKTVTPSTTSQTVTPTSESYYLDSVTVDPMPSGTAGTPTATKGSVSNHSVSVTPSVTNTTGYITGSTKTGTAVTVTAAELASGNKTITENGTNIDVVGYSTVSVEVQGGGTSGTQIGTTSATASSNSVLIFPVERIPTSFAVAVYSDNTISPGSTPLVMSAVWDGTMSNSSMVVVGQVLTNTNNQQVSFLNNNEITAIYSDYDNAIILSTGESGIQWVGAANGYYNISYTYGGSASDVHTADVQVGSGATSITFTGIEEEPSYFSCIFKSYFSTSSGYQRVIFVQGVTSEGIAGLEMDSGAHGSGTHWSTSYNNGSFTITSQGTNAGGYFHQPGYYQLTYATAGEAENFQQKSVTYSPFPAAYTETVRPDPGYDALKQVNVTIEAMPSGTAGTPTATKGTVSNHSVLVTPSVTNTTGYITGDTKTGTAVSVSASELVSGTVNITSSGNTDVTNYATASVASGSATASATKGTVSNHSVTVTPSVTRTAGYITAGSANGTAVTVSASELVSGSQTITENGTVNVTNLASVTVAIPIVTYYTGSSAPSSSLGSNGDIYLQS